VDAPPQALEVTAQNNVSNTRARLKPGARSFLRDLNAHLAEMSAHCKMVERASHMMQGENAVYDRPHRV
jgi:hypothetical protein